MNQHLQSLGMVGALVLAFPVGQASASVNIPVVEDVMTSPFFRGTDKVRGYAADNRPTLRVSNHNTNGMTGGETIYLSFNYDFSSFAPRSTPSCPLWCRHGFDRAADSRPRAGAWAMLLAGLGLLSVQGVFRRTFSTL